MISLLVVNYHSAALAADAIRTARSATTAPLQVVVVDNSESDREAESLRGVADRLVISPVNRGYAGAINLGRRSCDAETIIISNPDVEFTAGSIDRLQEELRTAAVAGPALFWDARQEWRLPPGDRSTAPEKIDMVLAGRSASWRRLRDRRRSLRRVKFWSLTDTTPVEMLSGAVLAVRRRDLDGVGGFDERFRLYFEETDFLRRISASRRRIVYVPAARCRHLFNQSAGRSPELSAARYAESELRYLEKWNGPFLARLLKRLERPLHPEPPQPLHAALTLDRDDLVVEVSPLATFETAAGHVPPGGEIDIPSDVWQSYTGDVLYLRLVERQTGDVLATYARYRT